MTGDLLSNGTEAPDLQELPPGQLYAQDEGDAVRCESCAVLVIDDDVAFQQFVSSHLRANGFIVLTASSGIEGLDMLISGARGVRVVLLDYAMPDLNGSATLQRLRGLHPSIKVVAVTSLIPEVVAADFREGVDAYIEKPVNIQELIDAIDRLAASKSP